MQFTRLGDTGLIVSRLAFGAMTFGSGEGAMAAVSKVDQKTADELVAQAITAGVNFFNTADAYAGGQSEQMLSSALGSRRKDVVIATKVGFRTGGALVHQGLSRQHIFASVEGSLRRLQTDYIDVYLVHRLDRFTPLDETLEALEDLVRQGKVLYTGFSNWPAWLAGKAIGLQTASRRTRFRAAELYYSLVGREVEHELVPLLRDCGVGLLVWSPLAGGFLTGKYTRENPQGDGGRLTGFDILPVDRERGYHIIDRLQAIGAAHGASPAQVALAWLLAKPYVTSVLVGASKPGQLTDNLAAASLRLTPDELAGLDTLSAPGTIYPNWFNELTPDGPAEQAMGNRNG
jgi:aryl-alcohol dehydrogenase-like predicted oxidoreductase